MKSDFMSDGTEWRNTSNNVNMIQGIINSLANDVLNKECEKIDLETKLEEFERKLKEMKGKEECRLANYAKRED